MTVESLDQRLTAARTIPETRGFRQFVSQSSIGAKDHPKYPTLVSILLSVLNFFVILKLVIIRCVDMIRIA